MKIKSLGSNKTELELKDLRLLVSYSTPVALIRIKPEYLGQKPALKTSQFHSVTTSKHINQWLTENGKDPKMTPCQDQSFFDTFLDDNT